MRGGKLQLDSLPRYKLATLPTPLDEAPRLSRELGVRVLVKRDDLTGFALGGNKARILEYLLADAIEQKSDMLVTGGGPQSNHARITAAAARVAGMDCVLVLSGEPPAEANGNLLLDHLLGAELVYTHSKDSKETDRLIEEVARGYRAKGRRPYAIGRGGSSPQGTAAYMLAVHELLSQLDAMQVKPDIIFITTGSCGTQSGILAGVKHFGANIPVYGITVSRAKSEGVQRIVMLVNDAAEFLDIDIPLAPDDIIINDDYLGAGYAIITPEARDAIRLVAQLEGIFLDPVYTGKTMAGMIALIRKGTVAQGSTVVFWHTGGAPGLFGHPRDFAI